MRHFAHLTSEIFELGQALLTREMACQVNAFLVLIDSADTQDSLNPHCLMCSGFASSLVWPTDAQPSGIPSRVDICFSQCTANVTN